MSGTQVAEKISWRMHPWSLQAKHQNVLSKQITSAGILQKHLPSNESRQQKKQLKRVKAKQRLSFDVGFYAQRQWLKWDAHGWQGWIMVGRSWSGCGYRPAALSLALGCSRRQGHMPEGELASLLPAQPGGFLKPLLSVFLSSSSLYNSKSFSSVHFRVDNILALHRVLQSTELKPEGILEDNNTVQPSNPGLRVKFCSHFLVSSNLL